MILEKKNQEIIISKGLDTLKINKNSQGDLFFSITSENKKKEKNFTIDKKDGLYRIFVEFIENIQKSNIYNISSMSKEDLTKMESDLELQGILEDYERKNKLAKNSKEYKRLIDEEGNIVWISDYSKECTADYLGITNINDEINLKFGNNLNIPNNEYSVIISSSDSRYQPFNICFMKFYEEISRIYSDDIIEKVSVYRKI